ncbi:MAG: hypothetical protein ACTSVY_15130 [Candidatus Helarchaeota archaeon]
MSEEEPSLTDIKAEITNYINDYLKNLGKGNDIEQIIENLRDEENKLRLAQDRYLNIFDVIQKVMEIRTNLNILAQHFLGCLKVAAECEDALCAKIFIQQSFSTLNQMSSFYQAEASEKIDMEVLKDLINSMKTSDDDAKRIISLEYIEKLEKIVNKLGEIIKEIPSARY